MAYLEYPVHQFFDNSGNPLASGKVYTYAAGTTTDLATYVSASGAANTNPVILDSAGRCDLWLADGSQYKLVIKNSSDSTIDTFDYVVGVSTGISSLASLSADLNTNGYSIKTTASNLDIPITPHGTGSTVISGAKLADSLDCNGYNIEMDNATGLVDDSGNETLILGKTASAVNYTKVTNAATGTNPTIAALGDDANVGLDFEVKGSGTYNFEATTSSATKIKLYEDADNGTNTTTITTDSSIASDATVTIAAVTGTLLNSANNLSDVGSASTARTNLGLAIGTNVAASGANTDLTSVYLNNTGLKLKDTNASHGLIIAPGSDITADRTLTITTGDASRTLTLTADSSIGGTAYISGGTDVTVADGGTGVSTMTTAYGVVCAGTTATGALQNAGAGTSGQVLTSNGASALPSFQAPGLVYLGVLNDSNSFSSTSILSGYTTYRLIIGAAGGDDLTTPANDRSILLQVYNNGGWSVISYDAVFNGYASTAAAVQKTSTTGIMLASNYTGVTSVLFSADLIISNGYSYVSVNGTTSCFNSTEGVIAATVGGTHALTIGNLTGLRLVPSSGSFTSSAYETCCYVYGVK